MEQKLHKCACVRACVRVCVCLARCITIPQGTKQHIAITQNKVSINIILESVSISSHPGDSKTKVSFREASYRNDISARLLF